jgi:hypothetical protein
MRRTDYSEDFSTKIVRRNGVVVARLQLLLLKQFLSIDLWSNIHSQDLYSKTSNYIKQINRKLCQGEFESQPKNKNYSDISLSMLLKIIKAA